MWSLQIVERAITGFKFNKFNEFTCYTNQFIVYKWNVIILWYHKLYVMLYNIRTAGIGIFDTYRSISVMFGG